MTTVDPNPGIALSGPSPDGPVFTLTGPRAAGGAADVVLIWTTRASAVAVLLMLAALVSVLTWASIPAIRTFGLSFITSTDWRPNELAGAPKLGPDGKVVI